MPNLEPGALITPTVRLVRPLAEGGMGRVWIADHLGLNTQVVVKVMAEEMAARPDGAERFAREAAVCAAIKNPHVVQIFDHGRTPEGVPYMVMELLEGQDLAAYIERHGVLEPAQVANLVVQIGRALSKAHRAGIVHRDIKPDNIFICDTDDGQLFVKLLDFGTAKRHDTSSRTTMPGQIMGTPYYMSPEQSVGAETDERSDIWSLGVVVFEALTGTRPFDGASIGAITMAIHGIRPTMASIVPALPPALDAWFSRACAQLPSDRFVTVREATSAFVEAVTGAPPVDQPTESIALPPTFPAPPPERERMSSAPRRPITRPTHPLVDTLPRRSERTTTIAAGMVIAIAALAMTAIVLGRSPSPAAPAVAETTTHAATTQIEPGPPAPELAPPSATPATPEPAPPSPSTVVTKAPAHAAKAHKLAPPPAKSEPRALRPASLGRSHDDDDLVKLQNAAAKHAEAPPESGPAARVEPLPTPAEPAEPRVPSPSPAPAPLPAPAVDPSP